MAKRTVRRLVVEALLRLAWRSKDRGFRPPDTGWAAGAREVSTDWRRLRSALKGEEKGRK